MDYLQHIEELLEAKMKRLEPISPVIFVSSHIFSELQQNFMRNLRYSPGSSSMQAHGPSAVILNTSLGQFTVMINKNYDKHRITNDGRSLDDILVEDILLGDGEIV